MMAKFYNHEFFPRGANATFVTLIPKILNPMELGDFRPISLVGCIYKIAAKTLALRLKVALYKVIDESQSAFLGGEYVG